MSKIIVDGMPIPFEARDSLLVAMLRADKQPTGGGCLCLGGDCPHCLATVDGISYVRTCQTMAKPGMVVERHHQAGAYPPLPNTERLGPTVTARHQHCDVVVIGQGEAGRLAATKAKADNKQVITVEATEGQEAVAVYAGPRVVVRTDDGILVLHPKEEIVVATGAAEIQPVASGSRLAGLLTRRAASQLHAAGLNLGRVVAIGIPPEGVMAHPIAGEVVRFEGDGEGRVTAVVARTADGHESRTLCDTVSVGLGHHPRNALALMGHDLPVRIVGDAAKTADIPPCPTIGTICPCSEVSVADLDYAWASGFQEMELMKRATLAGTGTCQGMSCIPYLQSYLLQRGNELQPRFTARPVNRQLTIGEIAAGAHHHATARTALDGEHRRLGAQMERSGHWWRPWTYGNPQAEYWAVREAVSIMDISTLGKIIVSGPDALPFLERIYPTKVATIKQGRSRYVLLLNERGYVFDDGLVIKEHDTRYSLTFTSGGSSHAEMWLRDWAHSWGMDVRILNQTYMLGAINVTGPLTNLLLARLGVTKPPKYMRYLDTIVADVPCRIYRLSFTGELSYEVHHPIQDSVTLWRTVMALGRELGLKPHGLETLLRLRLEKGHIVVGQDTDYDSTPRRIDHEWAVKLDKEFFIGKQALLRTNKRPLDKRLVGFEMAGTAPNEGAVIWYNGEFAGFVTSSAWSPVLNKGVMLGWLYFVDGRLPDVVQINGKFAQRVTLPFYDKEASRARA